MSSEKKNETEGTNAESASTGTPVAGEVEVEQVKKEELLPQEKALPTDSHEESVSPTKEPPSRTVVKCGECEEIVGRARDEAEAKAIFADHLDICKARKVKRPVNLNKIILALGLVVIAGTFILFLMDSDKKKEE